METFRLAELLRLELAELKPYAPSAGQFELRLDANEAPDLLSQCARERLAEIAAKTAWSRYPDSSAKDLRSAIADRCGVGMERIMVGVGSDEVITLLLTALCRPRAETNVATLLTTTPSFVMYGMSARVRGLRVIEVPLDAQWDLASEAMRRAVEMVAPNLVFIASPNNPTGTMMDRDRLVQIIEYARQALIVIDEAYVDYAREDQLDLCNRYPNVAVLRTLSKVGFAALRVGWLIAHPDLILELEKVRLPYNMNTLSQTMGAVVLRELGGEIQATCSTVASERELLAAELTRLGAEVTPSQANFLWFRSQRPAAEIFDALSQRGVLIRSFHQRGGRLAHQLRVTVGTKMQNEAFLKAVREVF